jgi:hypothetical protein
VWDAAPVDTALADTALAAVPLANVALVDAAEIRHSAGTCTAVVIRDALNERALKRA